MKESAARVACPHISQRNSGSAVLIFSPPSHHSRTWQRAELMCWRKAPYARREDYRGALSRSLVCEVNWFMLKYYIEIQLIPAVVPLCGFHFRTSSCQNRWGQKNFPTLCISFGTRSNVAIWSLFLVKWRWAIREDPSLLFFPPWSVDFGTSLKSGEDKKLWCVGTCW